MKRNRIFLMCSVVILVILVGANLVLHNDKSGIKKQEIFKYGIIPAWTESEMILDADLIITGEVKELLPSKWSNTDLHRGEGIRNILQTDVVINIEDILKGERTEKTVTVGIDKGEDAKTIVYSDGYPDFATGEKVLLFLSRDDSDVATNEDYYVLTGMKYGKYNISENKTSTSKNEDFVTYANEKHDFSIMELKERIIKEMAENPNYKAEKAAKQEEIRKRNIELFGE